jgi:hypothetical protein
VATASRSSPDRTACGSRRVSPQNLYDPGTLPTVDPLEAPPFQTRFATARTADGTYNDLASPTMGASGVRFGRDVSLEATVPDAELAHGELRPLRDPHRSR